MKASFCTLATATGQGGSRANGNRPRSNAVSSDTDCSQVRAKTRFEGLYCVCRDNEEDHGPSCQGHLFKFFKFLYQRSHQSQSTEGSFGTPVLNTIRSLRAGGPNGILEDPSWTNSVSLWYAGDLWALALIISAAMLPVICNPFLGFKRFPPLSHYRGTSLWCCCSMIDAWSLYILIE